MIIKIDGSIYFDMVQSGVRYLDLHRKELNDLNVFPVPDGDTGTNMSMTLKGGLDAIKKKNGDLGVISEHFSQASVFGARGNSGVILSQFFKGIANEFKGHSDADAILLSRALTSGCVYAYAAVAKPVEGTMLTVIKDASNKLALSLPLSTIDAAIDIFLNEAKASLNNTPNLLPILKKAGVVDSGGCGIVYFFEGVRKYLQGEEIEAYEETTYNDSIDLSMIDKNTEFEYGYCVEGLIQLRIDVIDFDLDKLKRELVIIGNSIVASIEKDKLKLHIHTKDLAALMSCIQAIGEFLTIKIDNMTVQNMQKNSVKKQERKYLYSEDSVQSNFAVVAVATNSFMQQKFFEMGADVVILSEIAPSSQEFMDAFKYVKSDKILVFPNSSNSLLTSMQAGSMYKKAKVTVLNSRSLVACYVSLPIIDFDEGIDEAVSSVNSTLSSLYHVTVYQAIKDIKFGNRNVLKNEFFALSDNKILNIAPTLRDVTLSTVEHTLNKNDYAVVTLFYGKNVSDDLIDILISDINELGFDVEIARVATFDTSYCISITFE